MHNPFSGRTLYRFVFFQLLRFTMFIALNGYVTGIRTPLNSAVKIADYSN
jgi:hypothetical protein